MNIYESIAKIMEEGYSISKNKRNTQGSGYMYRGIDDVMNTFQPLLSKYKVFVVPQVLSHTREERQTKNGSQLIYSVLEIEYKFFAEDGSFVSALVIGEGMDSGDKASNKAMSVGMKYAMFQVFCIPTEEMRDTDPDRESPPPSTAKEYICEKCGKPIKPVKTKTRNMTAKALAEATLDKYGSCLCYGCLADATRMAEASETTTPPAPPKTDTNITGGIKNA